MEVCRLSTISNELFGITDRLEEVAAKNKAPEIEGPVRSLEAAADEVGKTWSGSWFGYHSRVYYRDLKPPPPGARFDLQWGLIEAFSSGTVGEWAEYDFAEVQTAIFKQAGNPDLKQAREVAKSAREVFEDCREEMSSLLSTALQDHEDPFLTKLKEQAESLRPFGATDFINHYSPKGQFISRDTVALSQGLQTPPHLAVLAEAMSLLSAGQRCADLTKVIRRAASHLAKRERYSRRAEEVGTNVFIGHGGSKVWRDLKDFVQDRLALPWDEFNRVPVAGVTNVARLSEMLDEAAIAFLIMTAEDEQADGEWHARMNVVHEAGLFQGRLGFTKAIVLLEEGCEEFSNIQGLGQIRFPKGNIAPAFEEIRRVLEREGLI